MIMVEPHAGCSQALVGRPNNHDDHAILEDHDRQIHVTWTMHMSTSAENQRSQPGLNHNDLTATTPWNNG